MEEARSCNANRESSKVVIYAADVWEPWVRGQLFIRAKRHDCQVANARRRMLRIVAQLVKDNDLTSEVTSFTIHDVIMWHDEDSNVPQPYASAICLANKARHYSSSLSRDA